MNLFGEFFREGFFHIVDIGALDHILFILAVVAIYRISEWKKILWVITSFTIAHSVSLALSVLDIINIPSKTVELLIAFTICYTCIENIFFRNHNRYRVYITGFFGLIHGLGFSAALKSLFSAADLNLFETLLPFNLGIECGQLVIITGIMIIFFVLYRYLKIRPVYVNLAISIPVLLFSIYWIYDRLLILMG